MYLPQQGYKRRRNREYSIGIVWKIKGRFVYVVDCSTRKEEVVYRDECILIANEHVYTNIKDEVYGYGWNEGGSCL